MSVTGISEFTFGFGFLYEQTQKHFGGLVAAPILPSLKIEKDRAWDAKIPTLGVDYYYQFKLSELLFAAHAKYIKDKTYDSEYFRISLHKKFKNRQHNRLRALGRKFPNVFYVAPEIKGLENFNTAFLSGQVENGSRLIPVGQCKSISDSKQHYITFQEGNTAWKEHSQTVHHEISFFGRSIEDVYQRSLEMSVTIDLSYAKSLHESHVELMSKILRSEQRLTGEIGDFLEKKPEEETRLAYLRRVSELVSTFYGATFLIVGHNP
ncbi:MAG: hypothetical protein AB7Q37_10105 [Pyrinomonadaceae bacterium]